MSVLQVLSQGLDGERAFVAPAGDLPWQDVCDLEDVLPDAGVAALIAGRQIAVVRVGEGEQIYAIDHRDPFTGVYVMGRGIVGDKAGAPKITSPLHKQSFDLRTGQCFDDPTVRLEVFPARVWRGRVQVAVPESSR